MVVILFVPLVPLGEVKSIIVLTTKIQTFSLLNSYSSFTKLKRVMAYVLRFIRNTSKNKFSHLVY